MNSIMRTVLTKNAKVKQERNEMKYVKTSLTSLCE
jgi:hypothetical protein